MRFPDHNRVHRSGNWSECALSTDSSHTATTWLSLPLPRNSGYFFDAYMIFFLVRRFIFKWKPFLRAKERKESVAVCNLAAMFGPEKTDSFVRIIFSTQPIRSLEMPRFQTCRRSG